LLVHNIIKELGDEVTAIRRALHQIPEEGYSEYKTQEYILKYLAGLGLDKVEKVACTGVKAVFNATNPRRTIAFRADMDALSIEEKNQHHFVSKNKGLMHACGHDGHMAILLGMASLISRHRGKLNDNIVLLFQPAEESIGGAKRMIEEGALENPKVDMIFGLHILPDIPQGKIGIRVGPVMAQTCEFDILLKGKSAHGAMPHKGVDTIVGAAHLIESLQTIMTRSIDPYEHALISIGRIYGGERRNILAEETVLEGMIRTFNDEVYDRIKGRIKDILQGMERGFAIHGDYREVTFYPVVNNHRETTKLLESCVLPEDMIPIKPMMIAEDFSFFQKAVPGTYFFIGSQNAKKGFVHPLHSNCFDFDEEVLLYAIEVYRNLLEIE